MMRPITCLVDEPPMLVSKLITAPMGSWDVERIDRCFTPYDAEVIKGIPLCTRTTSDLWSWHYEKIGVSCV
jgi:hypothetical protein